MPTTINSKQRKLPHLITVWRTDDTAFDQFGNPSYAQPVYMWVRWEESSKLYRTSDGREVRSRANVFTDTPVGSYGDYVALGQHTSTSPITNALEIQDVRFSSTLSGSKEQHHVIV